MSEYSKLIMDVKTHEALCLIKMMYDSIDDLKMIGIKDPFKIRELGELEAVYKYYCSIYKTKGFAPWQIKECIQHALDMYRGAVL